MAYSSRAWPCPRCGASPPAQKLFSTQKKDQCSEVSGLPPPNVTRCDWVSLRAFSNPEEACVLRQQWHDAGYKLTFTHSMLFKDMKIRTDSPSRLPLWGSQQSRSPDVCLYHSVSLVPAVIWAHQILCIPHYNNNNTRVRPLRDCPLWDRPCSWVRVRRS